MIIPLCVLLDALIDIHMLLVGSLVIKALISLDAVVFPFIIFRILFNEEKLVSLLLLGV